MLDLKPFRKGLDKPEEWLEKLYVFLNENYWLELLLAGKLVTKNEKSTFNSATTVVGDLAVSGDITGEMLTLYQALHETRMMAVCVAAQAASAVLKNDADRTLKLAYYGSSYSELVMGGYRYECGALYTNGPKPIYFGTNDTVSMILNADNSITFPSIVAPADKAGKLYGSSSGLYYDSYLIVTEVRKNAANGYAGLDGSSKLTGSQQVYGTAANTACQGNDDRLVSYYGEMYSYENATATTIDTVNIYHALQGVGLGAGTCSGVTFAAGLVGAIASVADYSGTVAGTVLMTDVAHGLVTNDVVTIHGTTDYNGTYAVTRVDNDTFYVTKAWVNSQTGTWHRGARLTATAAGVYRVALNLTAFSALANKTFKFEVNKNATTLDNIVVSRRFSSTDYTPMAADGLVTLAAGDHVWISVVDQTDGTDITVRHCNLNMTRV